MRAYYIYRQTSKLLDVHYSYSIYKWLPPECLGYIYGTKELKKYFDSMGRFPRPSFSIKFLYGTYRRKFSVFNTYSFEPTPQTCYIIVDDKGRFREYNELVSRYKKRSCKRWNYTYQVRHQKVMQPQKRSITPDEIQEIKDEYGFTMLPIKSKMSIEPWDLRESSRASKSWKAQTKRRKQYKDK